MTQPIEILTVAEAAQRLGIHKTTLENRIARGQLTVLIHRPLEAGRQARRYVRVAEVEEIQAARPNGRRGGEKP